MQLGFVIDHTRCIGCHACTVACKSENEVPLGSFRTWVKYTEEGVFPDVRRSFAVLRCNQCTHAPCVTICPVNALDKRADGVVDVDPAACIGCKACMHGCPYDALYINESKGTAEKCHFCVHRTERGLAPACAVVCPTEAIIPGDFDEPESLVARMKRELSLEARKLEAGTGPNVFYREVSAAGIDPGLTSVAQGSIWSEPVSGLSLDAATFEALDRKAHGANGQARTVYDVPRKMLWGRKITGYLFAKSIAAGAFPAAWLAHLVSGAGAPAFASLTVGVASIALAFLALTAVLLVADLKRPARFFYILVRPNWSSWLARGTFVIAGYAALLSLWAVLGLAGVPTPAALLWGLGVPTALLGLFTAAYTGWLFAQAKGRVLWMKRYYWAHLAAQAMLAGSAAVLVAGELLAIPDALVAALGNVLFVALAVHALFVCFEHRLAPRGREPEYQRTTRLVTHGPFARSFWSLAVGAGIVAPLLLLLVNPVSLAPVAALLALAGLWVEEDVFVRAGQTLPIS